MNEVEHEISFDENSNIVLKKKFNVKKGFKSRASGSQFELKVRKDLIDKNWVVDKWTNNIDLEENKIIPAKRKFNPYSKVMTIGTGFPDFVCFQKMDDYYKIVGVEVKMNGKLSKIEKEKCAWYLKNKIFNEIWIAKKEKDGRSVKIIYEDFKEIYPKFLI